MLHLLNEAPNDSSPGPGGGTPSQPAASPSPDFSAFDFALRRYNRAPIAFVREVLLQQPDGWQIEALRGFAKGYTRHSIKSGHGVGKGHNLGLLVDTPDGRRRWGDLQPGDRLFGHTGEVTHIVARHELGRRPLYRVTFDDGTSTHVTYDHLWTVRGRAQRRVDNKRRWRRGVGKTEQTSTYAADYITISTADLIKRGVKRSNAAALARQWELPPHGATQYPPQDIEIPPYLLGASLADGTFTKTQLVLSGSAAKIMLWERHLEAADIEYRTTAQSPGDRYSVTVRGQMPGLRRLGLAGLLGNAKHVPLAYKENTPAVRLAMLQGLMDADGYCDPRGIAVYTSVSRQLADDVAWLVRSLGGKAHRGDARPSHYRKDGERIRAQDHYDVTVRLPPGLDLFTLPQKAKHQRPCQPRYLARWIESIEPDGEEEAMCVTVDAPDGLYLANDFIVTHNSCLAAWVVLWFICTRAPFKCALTAPSAPQLFDVLWPELLKWMSRMPEQWRALWDITADHITLKSDRECFVTARTSRPDKPEAMAGLHSANILLVADEASGIDEAVYEAAGGSMSSSGAITLLIGNPTRDSGFFWRTHSLERDRWRCMTVSSADSSRVDPGYVSEMAERYGPESNAYRVRVLGQFPAGSDDTFIPGELVDSAMARDIALDASAPILWGLDCARYGADASVLIKRQGNCVTEPPRRWRNIDLMALSGAVKHEFDLSPNSRPTLIAIDSIGLGAGVVDRLQEQGLPVLGINVSETPANANNYMRLRDELWARTREWLATRVVRLPRDDQLRDDLVAPRYTFSSTGKLQIESKESMRRRGLPSCDSADALMLSLAQQGLMVTSSNASWLFDSTPVMPPIPGME